MKISFQEMFSWVVNPFGINESSNRFTKEEVQLVMGARRGQSGQNVEKEPKFSRKPDVSSLIPINWFISCSDTLFAAMTLTLYKTTGQLQYPRKFQKLFQM